MLHFILGRAGYGKTEYVFNSIKKLVESGDGEILLLTPEQYSFVAERRLLNDLGESKISRVENASFTRLSSAVARLYGGDDLPVLSKGAKAVLMKKAIEAVKDSLVLFGNHASSNEFINSAIKIYDEMKACRVSCDDIIKAKNDADKPMLSDKLNDISLIISSYDAIIKDKYYDSADELTRLYTKLLSLDFFKDKTVFIDGFYGFVAQEYKIIEIILKQAKDVYVTFCTDTFYACSKYSLFYYINNNVAILRDVAKNVGVKIANPIVLEENHRALNSTLKTVERFSFDNNKEPSKADGSLQIYCAKNISNECDRVALEISKLLRQGYFASDISVVTRDTQKYKKELEFSFDKFNIPYYNDERQAVSSQPIIMFVNFLLRVAIYNFRSDDIFSLLKTGLTDLSDESINALENYAYMWSVDSSKWKKPFTNSTNGFVDKISDSDQKRIDELNKSREYVIGILEKFTKSVKNKCPLDICKSIYYTLIAFSCDKKLKELAIKLDENGKSALSQQLGRVWDLLMEMLDSLSLLGENESVTVSDFYKMFSLMVSSEDLGALPTGLDNVQLGSADRMRCDNPKVVFIVGANENEFPQAVGSSGLLSEADRATLIKNQFKLYSYGEILTAQERFFAYVAMSAPTEKLYVSYRGANSESESVIVKELEKIFSNVNIVYPDDELSLDSLETYENAFEILSSNYNQNSTFIASLDKVISDNELYSSRLGAVKALVNNENPVISDTKLARDLFGSDMYLSASKVEDYFNCAFRYFCKFGIGARPRAKAEMNALQTGIIIHFVLEHIIKERSKEEFVSLESKDIKKLVDCYLSDFLKNNMGSGDELTPRFRYQFMRLSKMLCFVVERLRDEFSQSDFEAKAFELTIGDGSGGEEIKSVALPLGDGGSVRIKGAIDRVDTYEENGKKYVRVVDYKSGPKNFLLSDIIYGLNMQMFIYLFSLGKTENPYAGIEAGVLYMHSSREVLGFGSAVSNNEIQKEENSKFKMNGIVLNDDEHRIAEHMEHNLEGRYIPVKSDSKNTLKGNIVTFEEIGKISRKIDSLLCEMGLSLHSGAIAQNPVNGKNHDRICEFCDYSSVCANRTDFAFREIEALSDSEVLSMIREGE